MFPLGTVVVPTQPIPLQLFEPRYLALIDDVLAGDRTFGTCLIERGSEVGGGDQRLDVATLVDVVDANRRPDGRWAVQGLGRSRIRVVEWRDDDPYPQAEVEEFPDPDPNPAELERLDDVRIALRSAVGKLLGARGRSLPDGWLEHLADDPSTASFQLAAVCPAGPLDRYRLLAAPTVGLRLALLAELVADLPDVGPGG